jgi:2-(3-amino-3-carboxypropyl)histidine synthase
MSKVKELDAKRVLLQLPDGMRPFAVQLVEAINSSTGANVFLSGNSCYGACDISIDQARGLGVDLIVHYGHTQYVGDYEIPVLYLNASIDVDVDQLSDAVVPELKEFTRLGLATTVQHVHQIDEIKEKLLEKGVEGLIGGGIGKTPLDGQILGCSYGTVIAVKEDVDAYLYIGGGKFHPTGIVMSTGKPVILANPYNGSVSRITEDDLMDVAKRRMAAVAYAKNASVFGILVSSKPGQSQLALAEEYAKRIVEAGKTAIIIYMDEVRPEHINNYTEPEVLVNTACPRIAIDGIDGIDRPLITMNELDVVLGDSKWEDLWGNAYLETA